MRPRKHEKVPTRQLARTKPHLHNQARNGDR
uniref:Uncharacterized protein n=1 Tax=Arundo donax TaxID=35708 RepID=A0A0A9C323_ARUDO